MNFFCGLGTPANGMIQRVTFRMEVETGMVFNRIERVESFLSGIEVLQDIGNRLLAGVCEIGKWHRDLCSSRNKKATQRFPREGCGGLLRIRGCIRILLYIQQSWHQYVDALTACGGRGEASGGGGLFGAKSLCSSLDQT